MLPLHAPPGLLTQTLTCMDLMCGLGAFHQAVRAANIGANRSGPHQGESHRLRCTVAVDIDPVTTAVYSTNYRGTTTVTRNLTDIAQWQSLAELTHIMMAGPPCQGWSAAGDRMQWSDPRILPLALVPLTAWGWGLATAIIEEVPAFISGGPGRWTILWNHLGFQLTVARRCASTTLPMMRPRTFITCLSSHVAVAASTVTQGGVAAHTTMPGLQWYPTCPFLAGMIATLYDDPLEWQGFASSMIHPIPPERQSIYFDRTVTPEGYPRLIQANRRLQVLLGMYTEQDASRYNHERGRRERVYGQLLQRTNGALRFLHPFEGLACMGWPIVHLPVSTWTAIGNTITLPQAGLALGIFWKSYPKYQDSEQSHRENSSAFFSGREPAPGRTQGTQMRYTLILSSQE